MKSCLSVSVFCAVAWLACGCSPSFFEGIETQYSPLNEVTCETPSDELYLFFSGEALDFDYLKLGLIEVEGESSSTKEVLLDRLKNEARNRCANGLINITSSYRTREDNNPVKLPMSDDIYSVEVITAIAVSIDQDDKFLSKHQANAIDVTKLSSKISVGQEKSMEEIKIASVVMGFLALVAVCLIVVTSPGY